MRALVFLFAVHAASGQVDPRAVVERSVQRDDQNVRLTRNYIYQVQEVESDLDGQGRVKGAHTTTSEVLFIGGKRYRHLLERDGKQLTGNEERKEREKLDKAVAAAGRLSQEELDRRFAEYEQQQAKNRAPLRDIPEAFDFKLLREETLNARPVYVISATPKPDYRGKQHEILGKIEGVLWIDQADAHWVKFEADTLDTISFGFFLARLAKGTHLEFEQTRVNDEIWMTKRAAFSGSARLGLVKKLTFKREAVFSKYRKFQSDSRIVSGAEAETSK